MQASVDVEATIAAKALAIGVFGPQELVGGVEAATMVAKMANQLKEVLDSS